MKNALWIGPMGMLIAVLLMIANSASAHVYSSWPDWENGKRKLRVWIDPSLPTHVKLKIMDACDEWTEALGEDVEFEFDYEDEDTTAANADITIKEMSAETKKMFTDAKMDVPGGTFLPKYGTDSEGDKCIKKGEIELNSSYFMKGVGEMLKAVTMHELGHAMRLAHSRDTDDVMHYPRSTSTEPSTEDLDEAKASDVAYSLGSLTPLSGLLRCQSDQELELVPTLTGDIELGGVVAVALEVMTGTELTGSIVSFDADSIIASMDVSGDADHNEVLCVTLIYGSGAQVDCSCVVTTNEGAPLPGTLPHAEAGDDLTIEEGDMALLDGSDSFHDDASEHLVASWIISLDGEGVSTATTSFVSVIDDLPVGVHTATLVVTDWHGRTSEDQITITVTP